MNINPNKYSHKIEALADFFQLLQQANNSILMLDYDGTLAPFRKNRDQAIPYKGVREILKKLLLLQQTRVIIISGRWIKDLIPLLGLDCLPEIWGSHGIERRKFNGEYSVMEMPESALQGIADADSWIEKYNLEKLSEEKPGCLALHWRGLDYFEIKDIQSKILPKWNSIAFKKKLLLKEFDGGIELRVPGMNKGHAVKTILKEYGNNSMTAYLGDDLTDEDAFNVLKGKGLSILVRKKYRDTAADIWLKPPQQLLNFLTHWHDVFESAK